uniref:Sulfhydryl oxidase n=1 Tax=Aceria tosichella TaxID=561515 RepID=A0A6G1SDW6_9ACAR
MSESTIVDQVMIHQTALSSRRNSGTSSRCRLPFGAVNFKQKTSKSLIIWLLVVYGLIQVTSNLINSKHNHHHHISTERSASFPPCQDPSACPHSVPQDSKANILLSTQSASSNHNHHNYAARNSYNDHIEECGTIHELEASSSEDNAKLCSSPASSLLTETLRAPLASLKSLYNSYACHGDSLGSLLSTRAIFGSGILLADAAQVTANSMYQASHDREIIVLNSTNFNTELIQYDHPFPHIKLIEYYLPYCGICLRFKQTYIQLSKDIYSWRNVIRLSAIDLGVSNNSPIAHSWSIDVVPTLRIHPPPKPELAAKLNEQLSTWSRRMQSSELQKAMYQEYSGANLMISSLGVTNYTNDPSKRDSVADKVTLLKQDLIRYIDRYVSDHPDKVPETWPNLRPVTEKTLVDLKRHHPRPQLFLIIELNDNINSADASNTGHLSSTRPGIGLEIIMELSSSPAWKAIRYVRAMDNKNLIEDVISKKKKEFNDQTDVQNTDQNSAKTMNLLNDLLTGKSNQDSGFILIHIDESHSPFGYSETSLSTRYPSIQIISSSDLNTTDHGVRELDKKAKRSVRERRDSEDGCLNDLVTCASNYIKLVYSETEEDRWILSALNSFDENPTSQSVKKEVVKRLRERRPETQPEPSAKEPYIIPKVMLYGADQQDDYEDKLKAIRYIFFQEVPRHSFADKSPAEKVEKLNTLINLASVIKAYFPLPDLASVQFIDAVHNYLSRQQTLLLASLKDQDPISSNFDLRSLKQVIKNIEAEGKRLPEIRSWKHCKNSGYPCAIWRLFHTLTAFEYKKLSQIYQLSTGSQQPTATSIETHVPPSAQQPHESQPQAQISEASPPMTSPALEQQQQQQNSPPSPVERLVSSPSTTTSLSLTIATPISSHGQQYGGNHNSKKYAAEIAELPTPVLLVMRDYIVNFFSCSECATNFRQEAEGLSFERIRQQEPAEFSILWLWETHNRVSKRLSINPETNPPEHPKNWYPTYEQCSRCYKKPPSYLKDTSVELVAIFHESIEWNRDEVLSFLLCEFTKQPMDTNANIFGYPLPYGFNYIIIIGLCSLLLIVLLRCASCYIERQRRHKANMLLNGGNAYSVELQRA